MPAREYRWRHLALLISILLLFVTAPVVVSLHDGILIMNVISVTVLVAGSYALSERKYLFAMRSCYRQSRSPVQDYRRVRRHRSALTGGTNHDSSGSGHGPVRFGGPGRAPGRFAHRARDRSALARLIVSPAKAQVALESSIVIVDKTCCRTVDWTKQTERKLYGQEIISRFSL